MIGVGVDGFGGWMGWWVDYPQFTGKLVTGKKFQG